MSGCRRAKSTKSIELGKLNEGVALVHARGRTWGPLIFQDLFKQKP